jgi:7-carboxy-7-deazaguanine synthase
MRISEIFHSIQGEGELTGVPSVFVRVSGCNLRCAWCDTPYALRLSDGAEMSVGEVLERVREYRCKHVVLTGGEPLMASGIHDLAAGLTQLGMHVTIETAGTILPDGICCDLASISPKLANSTPHEDSAGAAWVLRHEQSRLRPEYIREWLLAYHYQLKFVVSAESQIGEIQELLGEVDCVVPASQVILMPEGVTEDALAARRDFVVAACKQYGYRYCHRLQIALFGNTRGT